MQFSRTIRCLLAVALVACSPALVWAASASQQLQEFIAQVPAATGQFSQQRLDPDVQGQKQEGVFSFKRPGQFRWDVKKPYEQLILSDGKQLYQYDPDLAQVTRRGVDASIGASPAAILFGSGKLEDSFSLADLPAQNGLDLLRAKPRSADAGFTHVDIGFKNGVPVQLDLLDSFGQNTRITLTNIVVNPDLPADEFTFTPPEGVDVVNM